MPEDTPINEPAFEQNRCGGAYKLPVCRAPKGLAHNQSCRRTRCSSRPPKWAVGDNRQHPPDELDPKTEIKRTYDGLSCVSPPEGDGARSSNRGPPVKISHKVKKPHRAVAGALAHQHRQSTNIARTHLMVPQGDKREWVKTPFLSEERVPQQQTATYRILLGGFPKNDSTTR